jgi:hypothetical protein
MRAGPKPNYALSPFNPQRPPTDGYPDGIDRFGLMNLLGVQYRIERVLFPGAISFTGLALD